MLISLNFVWIFFIIIQEGVGLKRERFQIHPLNSPSYNLLHFDFEYEHLIDLHSIFSDSSYVWPRSFFDVIISENNIKYFKMETANGRVNEVLINNLEFEFDLPKTGTILSLNADCDLNKGIMSLNEFFHFEKKSLMENKVKIGLDSFGSKNEKSGIPFFKTKKFISHNNDLKDNNFIFTSSPDDFLCSDTLEKLKDYLLCNGERGVYKIIDLNTIFLSDYSSISSNFFYNVTSKKVHYNIELNFIIRIETKNPLKYFNQDHVEFCKEYDHSIIQSIESEKNEEKIFDLKEIGKMPINYVPIIQDIAKTNKNPEYNLKISKFLTNPVYDRQTEIIYELTNTYCSQSQVIIHEVLPIYFMPNYHDIHISLNHTKLDKGFDIFIQKNSFSTEKVLQFIVKVPPFSIMKLSIPINKIMKSFEEYPHDPAKGHYLIGAPVFFKFENDTNFQSIRKDNLLIRIPEPDFSMPFNISTFTFVALGYYFLIVFRMVISSHEEHWLFKKDKLIVRILKFIWLK